MRIYDQKQVEQLRMRYPKGTRLCLDFMDEPGMSPGLQGTVEFIDDAGQIHMHWENGSLLLPRAAFVSLPRAARLRVYAGLFHRFGRGQAQSETLFRLDGAAV